MSIPVPLEGLGAAIAERGPRAYLLTVSEDGRPHAVHVALAWDGDQLVADVGRRSAANVAARPALSLLYALRTSDDYSLIVDGNAVVTSHDGRSRLRITATSAILHRPAAVPDPASTCQADCVPVMPATRRDP